MVLLRSGAVEEVVEQLLTLITALQSLNDRQAIRIDKLLKRQFGRQSEKMSSEQLSLFLNELSRVATGDEEDEGEDSPEAKEEEKFIRLKTEELRKLKKERRSRRKRPGRNSFPDSLPRDEPIILKVPAEEIACPCCGDERRVFDHDESEVLEFVAAHFKVKVYRREKRACSKCSELVMGPVAKKPIEKGIPGPGLLAHVVVNKYQDSQPLNRLSGIYERHGVRISSSTLGHWIAKVCDILVPLYFCLHKLVIASQVLGCDDTPILVLDRKQPKNTRKGRIWAYVGYEDGIPIRAIFDFTPTWEGKHPRKFLKDRRGYLQSDGYPGLNPLFKGEDADCINVGCMAHNRRYYVDTLDAGDNRAAYAVKIIKHLYRIEEIATLEERPPEERKAARQEFSKPALERLGRWAVKEYPKAEPGTPFYSALTYTINQWASLNVYLEDGSIPIDNTGVERALRVAALGRKNYLFVGSDEGGRRAAMMYSFMSSCRLLGIDPLAWLTDVLDKLTSGWLQSRLHELLPENWTPPNSDAYGS